MYGLTRSLSGALLLAAAWFLGWSLSGACAPSGPPWAPPVALGLTGFLAVTVFAICAFVGWEALPFPKLRLKHPRVLFGGTLLSVLLAGAVLGAILCPETSAPTFLFAASSLLALVVARVLYVASRKFDLAVAEAVYRDFYRLVREPEAKPTPGSAGSGHK
jgi:hypothetical protein